MRFLRLVSVLPADNDHRLRTDQTVRDQWIKFIFNDAVPTTFPTGLTLGVCANHFIIWDQSRWTFALNSKLQLVYHSNRHHPDTSVEYSDKALWQSCLGCKLSHSLRSLSVFDKGKNCTWSLHQQQYFFCFWNAQVVSMNLLQLTFVMVNESRHKPILVSARQNVCLCIVYRLFPPPPYGHNGSVKIIVIRS